MDYKLKARHEKLARRYFWSMMAGYMICVVLAIYLTGLIGLVIVVAPLTLFSFWTRCHAELEYMEGEDESEKDVKDEGTSKD